MTKKTGNVSASGLSDATIPPSLFLWLSIVDFCLRAKGLGKEQGSALGKMPRKEARQRRSCVIKILRSILDGVGKIKKLKLLLSYGGIPSKIISKF